MHVFGVDAGFRKTGITVFELRPDGDFLIHADALKSKADDLQYKSLEDLSAMNSTLEQLEQYVSKYAPKAMFVELPSGGSKSARASTCMAMTKAMIGCFSFYNPKIAYEFMVPVEIEKLLGIKLDANDAKGMKPSDKQKWKKERSAAVVQAAYPAFDGWPEAAYKREDAYDSAAAFLAARIKNQLYKRLKAKVS